MAITRQQKIDVIEQALKTLERHTKATKRPEFQAVYEKEKHDLLGWLAEINNTK